MDPTPLQRALAEAPTRNNASVSRSELEFFCFRLGGLRLGVPSENVREVTRPGLLTPLPRMAAFVMGVFGHRGEVLPVLDLLRFLGKGEGRLTLRSRLFIGVSGTFIAAVLTDAVLGLVRYPSEAILPAPLGGDGSAEHLMGVVQAGSLEATTLLNFPKLLQSARQRVVAR